MRDGRARRRAGRPALYIGRVLVPLHPDARASRLHPERKRGSEQGEPGAPAAQLRICSRRQRAIIRPSRRPEAHRTEIARREIAHQVADATRRPRTKSRHHQRRRPIPAHPHAHRITTDRQSQPHQSARSGTAPPAPTPASNTPLRSFRSRFHGHSGKASDCIACPPRAGVRPPELERPKVDDLEARVVDAGKRDPGEAPLESVPSAELHRWSAHSDVESRAPRARGPCLRRDAPDCVSSLRRRPRTHVGRTTDRATSVSAEPGRAPSAAPPRRTAAST